MSCEILSYQSVVTARIAELRSIASDVNPYRDHTPDQQALENKRQNRFLNLIASVSVINDDDWDAIDEALKKSKAPLASILATVIEDFISQANFIATQVDT